MSDTALRELERRWQESGSPADEAAYLAARLRQGELDRIQLEVAAWAGRRAASSLTQVPSGPDDPLLLVIGLAAWSHALVVRGVNLAVSAALTGADPDPDAAQALDLSARWVEAPHTVPAEALRGRALVAAQGCDPGIGLVIALLGLERVAPVAEATLREILAPVVDPTRSVARACAASAWAACCAATPRPRRTERLREAAEWALSAAAVRFPDTLALARAVRGGLLRWALRLAEE